MKKILICIFSIVLTHNLFAQDKNVWDIQKMLSAQIVEWNKGNIDGYMKGYWENDSLLFIGSKGPRYGYEATLKRYMEAYPDTAHMGKLISKITSIQKLSDEYYFVVGTWALKRSVGDADGSYTLLIRKIKGKWVIICDHSS
ncbi:MAG: YybH family protein [Chitinophagales bacterium]